MSQPVVVTAPTQLPISYDEAMAILRDPQAERGYINQCMQAATMHAEDYLHRALITRTYDLYLDSFFTRLALPMPPATSVTSIKYDDVDNNEQTASSALYEVDTISDPGVVYLLSGSQWPDLVDSQTKSLNRVRVRYVAGYGDQLDATHAKIKMGILQLTAHYFRERQTLGSTNVTILSLTGEALLAPYIYHGS